MYIVFRVNHVNLSSNLHVIKTLIKNKQKPTKTPKKQQRLETSFLVALELFANA